MLANNSPQTAQTSAASHLWPCASFSWRVSLHLLPNSSSHTLHLCSTRAVVAATLLVFVRRPFLFRVTDTTLGCGSSATSTFPYRVGELLSLLVSRSLSSRKRNSSTIYKRQGTEFGNHFARLAPHQDLILNLHILAGHKDHSFNGYAKHEIIFSGRGLHFTSTQKAFLLTLLNRCQLP